MELTKKRKFNRAKTPPKADQPMAEKIETKSA